MRRLEIGDLVRVKFHPLPPETWTEVGWNDFDVKKLWDANSSVVLIQDAGPDWSTILTASGEILHRVPNAHLAFISSLD